MIDQFYTPGHLADIMVDAIPSIFEPNIIADFAVGGGSLLSSAQNRWPNAAFVANDIDDITVTKIRTKFPKWFVSKSNFLDDCSLKQTKIVSLMGKVDLALLNPPFSVRGSARVSVYIDGNQFHCSPAMAFVLKSTQFLSTNGHVVAVLPEGCLFGFRDNDAWAYLRSTFDIKSILSNDRSAFKKVSPKTNLVLLKKSPNGSTEGFDVSVKVDANALPIIKAIGVIRGNLPACKTYSAVLSSGIPLIHTTNLRSNSIINCLHSLVDRTRGISGPIILLPRVGRPSLSKIVLYNENRPIALSDCVLAIKCHSSSAADQIFQRINMFWPFLEKMYRGTGAPYISIDTLKQALMQINILFTN